MLKRNGHVLFLVGIAIPGFLFPFMIPPKIPAASKSTISMRRCQ